jgi:hypothetical protein
MMMMIMIIIIMCNYSRQQRGEVYTYGYRALCSTLAAVGGRELATSLSRAQVVDTRLFKRF